MLTKLNPVQQLTRDFIEGATHSSLTFLMYPLDHVQAIEYLIEVAPDEECSPEELVECLNAIKRYQRTFKDYYGMRQMSY